MTSYEQLSRTQEHTRTWLRPYGRRQELLRIGQLVATAADQIPTASLTSASYSQPRQPSEAQGLPREGTGGHQPPESRRNSIHDQVDGGNGS